MTRRQRRYAMTQRLRHVRRLGYFSDLYAAETGVKPPKAWWYNALTRCHTLFKARWRTGRDYLRSPTYSAILCGVI